MTDLSFDARVAAAMSLLAASEPPDYDRLPAEVQVHYQEAIEHLRSIDGGFPGHGA